MLLNPRFGGPHGRRSTQKARLKPRWLKSKRRKTVVPRLRQAMLEEITVEDSHHEEAPPDF